MGVLVQMIFFTSQQNVFFLSVGRHLVCLFRHIMISDIFIRENNLKKLSAYIWLVSSDHYALIALL